MPWVYSIKECNTSLRVSEILKFSEAINKSLGSFRGRFTADVQDFHAHLTDAEQNAIKNSLLPLRR